MIDDRDPWLAEIERALAIDPSPGFEARVRAQALRASRRSPIVWWAGMAALGAAAAMLLVVWTHRERAAAAQPGVASAAIAPAPLPSEATPPTAREPTTAAVTTSVPSSNALGQRGRVADDGMRRHAAAVPVALVPSDQRVAFRRLMTSLERGGVMPVAFDFAPDGDVTPLAEPDPIAIPALEITAIDTSSTGFRGDNQ